MGNSIDDVLNGYLAPVDPGVSVGSVDTSSTGAGSSALDDFFNFGQNLVTGASNLLKTTTGAITQGQANVQKISNGPVSTGTWLIGGLAVILLISYMERGK